MIWLKLTTSWWLILSKFLQKRVHKKLSGAATFRFTFNMVCFNMFQHSDPTFLKLPEQVQSVGKHDVFSAWCFYFFCHLTLTGFHLGKCLHMSWWCSCVEDRIKQKGSGVKYPIETKPLRIYVPGLKLESTHTWKLSFTVLPPFLVSNIISNKSISFQPKTPLKPPSDLYIYPPWN